MTEGHHTREQVAAAYARAPEILRELVEAGVELPRFTLFSDASGSLTLGEEVTPEQLEIASRLVNSRRVECGRCGMLCLCNEAKPPRKPLAAIRFCCGLVGA